MNEARPDLDDPHAGASVLSAGARLDQADAAIVLLHGRGSSAHDIMALGLEIGHDRVALFAPQALNGSWYPHSFLADIEQNEPYLSSAHRLIEGILARLSQAGLGSEQCGLVGFSQGACLATDHAYRFPRRYAFVAGLTGGLIGPQAKTFEPEGDLGGTPVYLAGGDPDPHVPWSRVQETARVLGHMGANVTSTRHPGAPHAVLPEQIDRVRELVSSIASGAGK